MKPINDELRLFIKDVTLFLQKHSNCTPEKIGPMFQRAYKLYIKYDVENEQSNPADGDNGGPIESWEMDNHAAKITRR